MKVLLLPDWERRHPLLATFGRRIYELGVIAMHPVPRAMHAINRRGVPVSDAEKAYIGYRYEQCIHHLDSHIGGIVGYLDSTGLIEDTAVIVTADHGDELFERGRLGHGRTLYEELIHVPLIAHFPGRDAPIGVWHEPVRHVDVMPTIAEALGIQSDGCVSGRSLLRGLEDDPFQPGPVFSEGVAPNGSSACMIDGNLKVILNDTTDSPELYDLEVDPGERMDLASTQLGEAERLAAKLRGVVASAGVAAEDRPEAFEIPAEVEKRLRDLGYW
jgi:arylsulfatase A-like enzyme